MANTNDKNRVTAGKPKVGGCIFRAPAGSTLPTDAAKALDPAFKCLGYISDKGIEVSNSKDVKSIKAWGGDTVLTVQTGYEETYKFSLIEALNEEVLKTVRGDANVNGTLDTGLTVSTDSSDDVAHAYVIEQILNGNTLFRTVIPTAKVKEVGSVTYADGDPVAYEVTLAVEPGADGKYHHEYYSKGA